MSDYAPSRISVFLGCLIVWTYVYWLYSWFLFVYVSLILMTLLHLSLCDVHEAMKQSSFLCSWGLLDIAYLSVEAYMQIDAILSRDARLLKKQNHVGHNDSYEMGDMAMPLHQYINDPIALDIVHNGATFQIAGLTNNSYMAESHEVRACIRKHPALGDSVLDVAKRRLDHMLYVGVTEDHKESATVFAHVVGAQLFLHWFTNAEQHSPPTEFDSENSLKNSQNGEIPSGILSSDIAEDTNNADTSKSKMTVKKLMKSYEVCISRLLKNQALLRMNDLSRISPVNFTNEARLQVPESVINQIISLNKLDMELYKYAQDIFSQQRTNTVQNLMQESEEIISDSQ
ncbi:protein-tyrosine sulfotransferase-like [Silene latifolia]|uniref:protein-tyrosine sulfotransferase-like n=1 Tax=Silene latifolia TaxID=37657 RepID=UPI003D77913A